jgi:hypothetical protein
MNGELAQIISLVAHGNSFLHSPDAAMVDFSTNSTLRYVSSIKFARYKSNKDILGLEIANSVSNWFAFLRSIKVTRLWNIAFGWQRQDIPEHIAVSFSGGVPAAIQADLPDGFELWYPQWKTGGQSGKPWFVEYRSLMFPDSHALPVQKLSAVKNQLKQAISQAEYFSRRPDMDLSNWATIFTNALGLLDSPDPKTASRSDMLPDSGFCLDARQILASAAQAYVFGGMGSWNDMGFEKPEVNKEYERITKELYEAVKFAIVMASNSFAL